MYVLLVLLVSVCEVLLQLQVVLLVVEDVSGLLGNKTAVGSVPATVAISRVAFFGG